MDTGTKFATSAFQHDNPVTLNAQGHGHSFIGRIQHLTSHLINFMPCHQTSLRGGVFIIYDPCIVTSLRAHHVGIINIINEGIAGLGECDMVSRQRESIKCILT
jgi:hypothetical protein